MIRPFQRSDREQLTALVNAHIGAVVPGVSVSVNALMSQLEREPGETTVDPWVVERRTLVAIERERVVAGAHILRYGDDDHVSESYRNSAEIRWLVHGHTDARAADELVARCGEVMEAWGAGWQGADGSLPGPFVYGIPDVWPHIRQTLVRAGFVHQGHIELVLLALVDDLPASPRLDLELRRSVGTWTRLSASRDGNAVGYIELETDFTAGGTLSRYAGWADIGNLVFDDADVGISLLAHARAWLRLARIDRVISYAWPEQTEKLAFHLAHGFRELVRTERGWVRRDQRR
jgi:hypothetical protein